jgi:hypothetical protein
MVKLARWIAMAAGLGCMSPGPGFAAESLPPQLPIEVLAIETKAGGLAGPGAERLREEIADAQFIAVGEDHGFADPPRFAAALAAEVERVKGAPLFLAVEVGPNATALVGDVLRSQGLPGLDRLLEGKPASLPFLSNKEDAELALPFARRKRLWGIDQEFVGSMPLLDDLLIGRTDDRGAIRQLGEWRDMDLEILRKGKFDQAVMTSTDLSGFENLRPAFLNDAKANMILDDLIGSAKIYRYNDTQRYAENNEQRSRLMQRYFLEQFRAVKGERPRVLFKMGAYHLGRGTTPTEIYDLGSLLPGLAAANGKRSLHIALVPMAGKVRSISPSAQGLTAVGDYNEDAIPKLLDAAGIARDSIPEHGWVLIPLEPIRQRLTGTARREMGKFGTFIVLGFDYLVTTRDATPATHFEAWSPSAESD